MKHFSIAFILSAAALSLPAAAYDFISVPGAPEMFGAGWDTSANLLSRSGSDWSGSITPLASSGEFKFAANKSWDVNWGGDFSILRVPAYGIGPLLRNERDFSPPNISWSTASVGTAHTFVFHENTATFDILPDTPPSRTISSVQLVGDFNNHGTATSLGNLSRSGSVWSAVIPFSGKADSFQLLVNGKELWGPAGLRESTLPVSGVSMCGASSLAVSDMESGALVVSFDADTLLFSIFQQYESISVPGDLAMFGADWEPSSNLLTTHSNSAWSGSITPRAPSGEFKFAANNSWNHNWGGDFSILRLPANNVGPLVRDGGHLAWHNATAGAAHTFVFHEDTATFDILPATTPSRTVNSVQLLGNFNNHGTTTNGILSRSNSVWVGTIPVSGGSDSFQLLVNGTDRWGSAGPLVSSLPATNVSMCGASEFTVSGIKRGTLAVSFNPTNLLLSVSQATTNAFEAKYIAADVSFAALSWGDTGTPCTDVNLQETNGTWTAEFVVPNDSSTPFSLTLSERGDDGRPDGFHWGTTNTSTLSCPVSQYLVRTDNASEARPIYCKGGGPGRYRITFAPVSQLLTVTKLYYQNDGVNLVKDPSLELCDEEEGKPTGGGVSVQNARIVDAVLDNGVRYGAHSGSHAAFFPPKGGGQDNPSDNFGSLYCDIPVGNAAGASLRVSACIRAHYSWEGNTQFQIVWYDDTGSQIGEHRYNLSESDIDPVAWKTFSTEAVIPENARTAHVVYLYSSAPPTGGLLVDDLEIRLSASRNQTFDSWTQILNASDWPAYAPDWGVTHGQTVDNAKDIVLPQGSLLISKYIEGTGNNKAIEIFNGTDDPFDLSQCELVQYDNGATSPTTVIPFPSKNLAPGACFVVTRSLQNPDYPPNAELLAAASSSGMTNSLLTFNGDDAIVLRRKDGTVFDRVGQVSSAATSSFWAYVCKNRTLVRKSTVHTGTVSAVTAPFDLSQWNLLPCDDFTGLGSHSRSLGDDVFLPSGLSLVLFNKASLVSPALDGGIGDLSFWYRAAATNNPGSATLRVEAAADATFSNAVVLAELDVPPSLVTFANFSVFLNRSDLSFLRFTGVSDSSASRVRLDDIYVTASIPSSRYQDFNAWTNASWAAYDGTYSLSAWTIANGRISPASGASGTPAALLKSKATVTSPTLDSGIGTVVFSAVRPPNSSLDEKVEITLETSSNGGSSWTNVQSFLVPTNFAYTNKTTTNYVWTNISFSANIPSNAAIRFGSSGDAPTILDNIELRVFEGIARSQNFNSWSVDSAYTKRDGQGWSASKAAVDTGPSGNCLRMNAKGATITSPVFPGGLGTFSLDVRSYPKEKDPTTSANAPKFSAAASTDGGTTFPIPLVSNALSTNDVTFRTFSKYVGRSDVNCVRIQLENNDIIQLDNIVCDIIKPPPTVDIFASVSPDPLDLETPFKFSASIQPSDNAAITNAFIRWQTVVGKTTNFWTTNALTYSSANDLWVSPAFSPRAEGTRIHYQAFARWTSPGLAGIQTSFSDIYTNFASSVAGGGVWINEIYCKFYGDEADDWWGDGVQDHEYVEICGPANHSIGGWSLRFEFARQQEIGLNSNKAEYAQVRILPLTAALTNHVEDGYGFFVVGDSNSDWPVNRSLGSSYVPTSIVADAVSAHNNIHDFHGVIRLLNENGSQIDAISYGRNYGGLAYAGKQPDDDLSSLSLTGSNGWNAASFTTNATGGWTNSLPASPGSVNPGQTFTNRTASQKSLPDRARHNPDEEIHPVSSQVASFFMLDPEKARVADALNFAVAFPSAYGDQTHGTLFYRRESGDHWVTNGIYVYGGARNEAGEDILHLPTPLDAYTLFKRLETVSYYFSVTPSDSSYLTGYLASDGNGGSLVYSNEIDAIDHPFTYTFPFHDALEFTSFVPTDTTWMATFVDDGEYTTPPAWDELRLEVTNSIPTNNLPWFIWTNWVPGDIYVDKDEHYTEYRLFLGLPLPPSPAFFRLAPARQPVDE